MIEIVNKQKENGSLRYATVKIRNVSDEYELDIINNRERLLMYDTISVSDLYSLNILDLPLDITLSTDSCDDQPKQCLCVQITKAKASVEIEFLCTFRIFDWKYPCNFHEFLTAFEEITNSEFSNKATFINNSVDGDTEYDFIIVLKVVEMGLSIQDAVEFAGEKYREIFYETLERLGVLRNTDDIVEVKPNFCGVGLNINALLRKFKKKLANKSINRTR